MRLLLEFISDIIIKQDVGNGLSEWCLSVPTIHSLSYISDVHFRLVLVVLIAVDYFVDGLMKLPPKAFFLVVVGDEHHGVEDSYNVADTHILL